MSLTSNETRTISELADFLCSFLIPRDRNQAQLTPISAFAILSVNIRERSDSKTPAIATE